jgi:hypothetical protein
VEGVHGHADTVVVALVLPEVDDLADAERLHQLPSRLGGEVVETAAPVEPAGPDHSPVDGAEAADVAQVQLRGHGMEQGHDTLLRSQPASRSNP